MITIEFFSLFIVPVTAALLCFVSYGTRLAKQREEERKEFFERLKKITLTCKFPSTPDRAEGK